jgi:hypothetical protein
MITIDRVSPDPKAPYANLVPIVERLVELGNVALDGGFILNPDGWRCSLEKPIDAEAVRREFVLPSNVTISEEYDTIHDSGSWCTIEGPGAHNLS